MAAKKTYDSYHEAVSDQVMRVEFSYGEAQQLAKLMNEVKGANGVYTFGRLALRFANALARAEKNAAKAVRR
jgi:hypothetical protein